MIQPVSNKTDNTPRPSVGVVVLTYNAAKYLENCLRPVLASPLAPKILVVDSSSRDGTVALAQGLGIETLVIPQSQFNHGATRELARKHLGTDIAVMLTQDIIPTDPAFLANLIAPIAKGEAAISYARQIPHDGAGFFESFPRSFNYPPESELRSIQDIKRYGVYTFFCSDSCCAWSNAALDSIGGFETTLSLEDTVATAKLLKSGFRIAYRADAVVKHSHHYSLAQEFKRCFDIGYVRALHKDLLFAGGSDEARGSSFLKAMLSALLRRNPFLIPYGVCATAAKFLGYRIGAQGHNLSVSLKRRLSGQPYYWK